MKYKTAILLFVCLITIFGTRGNEALAQTQSQTTVLAKANVSQPYNFNFRLRNENRQIRTQEDLYLLLRDVLAYLRELQAALDDIENEVGVETRSAEDITDDSAQLRGEITDFDDAKKVQAWFEYGMTSTSLTKKTKKQNLRVGSSGQYDVEVHGLRSDTKYYFRATALGSYGETQYGSVMSFTTDDIDHHDEPVVTTRSATSVTDDSIVLHGTVDMNDYRNGQVFFVYGEDEDFVTEVADEFDTYEAVDEQGEDLQKVLVDSDLDSALSYQLQVTNISASTKLYFTLCVAYENGESSLACGDIRNVTTES